jgi:LmbE family N-acetylglucosaminyl deacetylase
MAWIYLSPHFDDVALSCGGLVWEQAQAGKEVSIWTICAGEPAQNAFTPFAESLHERWNTGQEAGRKRRQEDRTACARLGAAWRHFPLLDCIYRRAPEEGPDRPYLYTSEESLFGRIHPAETGMIQALCADLQQTLPDQAEVVCPLTLGGHVDHRLTFAAASLLERPLWYYADYPYAVQHSSLPELLEQAGWERVLFPVSEEGLQAWVEAVAAYESQISTFWADEEAMKAELQAYARQMGGVRLWRKA